MYGRNLHQTCVEITSSGMICTRQRLACSKSQPIHLINTFFKILCLNYILMRQIWWSYSMLNNWKGRRKHMRSSGKNIHLNIHWAKWVGWPYTQENIYGLGCILQRPHVIPPFQLITFVKTDIHIFLSHNNSLQENLPSPFLWHIQQSTL